MQIFIDVLLIAVLAFMVFRGWWKGFIKAALSLARLVLSLAITLLAGSAVAGWLDQAFINPTVYKAVYGKLSDIAADVSSSAEGGVQALVDKIPESYRDHLDLESVDPTAKIESLVESWSRSVSDGISNVVSTVVGYILLFAVCFLVFTLAIFIINKCVKASALRKADKLLGLVVGLVSGVASVMFLSVVLGAVLSVLGLGDVAEGSFMLDLFSGLRALIFK